MNFVDFGPEKCKLPDFLQDLPTNSPAEFMNRKLQTEFCAFWISLSIQKFLEFEYFHFILSISLHKIQKKILVVEFWTFLKTRLASSLHIILK